MRKLLLPALLLALLCPAAAQGHELSSSAAKVEARHYAESLVGGDLGSRVRIHSCRRHSAHAVSCAFRITSRSGPRCGGRVRTAYLNHASPDTVSRVVADRCR